MTTEHKPHSELVARSLLSPEPREGMVMVYDYDGQYVGCMGQESWAWLLEQGYEHVRAAVENLDGALKAAYDAEEVGDELRREKQRLEEQLGAAESRRDELQGYLDATLAFLRRDPHEPWETDISDFSDEWCAGFFVGQENAQDVLDRAASNPARESS